MVGICLDIMFCICFSIEMLGFRAFILCNETREMIHNYIGEIQHLVPESDQVQGAPLMFCLDSSA